MLKTVLLHALIKAPIQNLFQFLVLLIVTISQTIRFSKKKFSNYSEVSMKYFV